MIEVTDEMEFKAWDAYTSVAARDCANIDQVALREALAAVAPLIEAQARAERETITAERNRMVDRYERLEADLAQARAEIEMWRVRCFAAERHMRDRDGDSIECGDICQLETLRSDLAQARAAAIEEADRAIKRAAWMAKHACLVEPDGGSPTQAECDLCDEAERRILSLLSRPVSEREGDEA